MGGHTNPLQQNLNIFIDSNLATVMPYNVMNYFLTAVFCKRLKLNCFTDFTEENSPFVLLEKVDFSRNFL